MTLRTALVIDGDSKGGQQALAQLERAMESAEAEAKAYSAAYDAADNAVAKLAGAQAEARREIAASKAALDAGELSLEQYERQVLETKSALSLFKTEHSGAMRDLSKAKAGYERATGGIEGTGKSARLASHHVQNLSFQFTDLGVSLASGMPPMMAFMQQGAQIGGIMGQAGIGVGGLAKEAAGMVGRFAAAHPVLLAAGAAAGVAYGGFKLFTSEVEKSGELDRFVNSLGLTKDELEELGPATITVGDAFTGLWRTIDDAFGLSEVFAAIRDWAVDAFKTALGWGKNAAAGIYAGFVGTYNGIAAVWPMLPGVIGEAAVNAANMAIAAIEKLINAGIAGLNSLVGMVNDVLGTSVSTISPVALARMEDSYRGAGQAAVNAMASGYSSAFDEAMAGMNSVGATWADNTLDVYKERMRAGAKDIIDDRTAQSAGAAAGKKIGRPAGDAAAKELKAAFDEGMRYLSGLENEIAIFGKTVIEIQRVEVAAAAAAADKAGLAKLAAKIRDAGDALEKLQLKKVADEFDEYINGLQAENSLIGLVGEARERAALALEEQAFKARMAADGIQDVEAAWQRYLSVRLDGIDRQSVLNRDLATAQLLGAEIYRMVGAISSASGIGGLLGGLLGFSGGQDGAIGGQIGALLNTVVGSRVDDRTGDVIAKTLGDELRTIFGLNGEFGRTLTKALGNAGIGAIAGQAVLGKQGTGGQIGSAVGGIVGGIAGEAFKGALTSVATNAFGSALGGAIGSAVPVVGTILGGILGGLGGKLVSGLFGGTKKGSAIFDAGGVTGFYGNSGDRKDAAAGLADQAIGALAEIADAFGAQLNAAAGKVSIGIRKDDIVVDPTGRGKTKTSDHPELMAFGKDAGGAVSAAVLDLIKDGAIAGLRAGTQKLLTSGGDLKAQLEKALAFEGVFKSLAEEIDPAKAALAELEKEYAKLVAIFDEAGASAEERAQLETLYAKRRDELTNQEAASDEVAVRRRELEIDLMIAQGDVLGALAATRADELAQLDPTLRALQEQIWAAQLANDRRQLEIGLMEAQGDASGALAARREQELAAIDPSLRALQEQIWAARDAAEASQALADSQLAVAELMRVRRGLEIDLMEAQGNASGALAARRAQELAALDPSLRALQEQVWAARDAAEANQALAAAQQAAAEIARARSSMEIELLDAQGNAAGALAARRAQELAALDPALRALQEQIWSTRDAADAQLALARAQDAAADAARVLERERRGLEIELMQATGDSAGALAAQRTLELAALDESLQALQQQVWAAQDAAAAQAELASAQEAAAERTRAAAAEAAAIASQRGSLEIQLLRANGFDGAAIERERTLELAGLDESLHDLQREVWAARDAASAAAEAERQRAAAEQAAQEAAQRAEDAARAAAERNRDRRALEAEILDLQGDAMGAVLMRRQLELDAMDGSLHALQRMVWALEDARKAEEELEQARLAASIEVEAAYRRERDALRETADRFTEFGDSLRAFRGELTAPDRGLADAYRTAQVDFIRTSALAANGDEAGLRDLRDVSSTFLEASKANAGSLAQYQRDVALVTRAVDAGIAASDEAVDYAELQLAALDRQVDGLLDIDESVKSVAQAIAELEAVMAGQVANSANPVLGNGATASAAAAAMVDGQAAQLAALTKLGGDLGNRLEALQRQMAQMQRLWDRYDDGDGLRVVVAA